VYLYFKDKKNIEICDFFFFFMLHFSVIFIN
jgi:hypothetical protein